MEKQIDKEKPHSDVEIYASDKYKVRISNGFLTVYNKETDGFGNEYWSYSQDDVSWKIKDLIEELVKKQIKEVTNVVVEEPKV